MFGHGFEQYYRRELGTAALDAIPNCGYRSIEKAAVAATSGQECLQNPCDNHSLQLVSARDEFCVTDTFGHPHLYLSGLGHPFA
jgi:hypothetical protein